MQARLFLERFNIKGAKQSSDPAPSCASQSWKNSETVVPELLDASELEGSGRVLHH